MIDKPFKTLDEQIQILESRHLLINDKNDLRVFLEENNYYRISGYFKMFTKPNSDDFIDGFSFEQLKQVYYFDSSLRVVVNELIARIEIMIKTQIAYHVSSEQGPLFYKRRKCFKNLKHYLKMRKNIKREIGWCSKENKIIKRYGKKDIPIWALVELLTFGTVSKMYNNLLRSLKTKVCSGGCICLNHSMLSNYLQALTSLRNTCAHRGKLYGNTFITNISIPKNKKPLFEQYGYKLPNSSNTLLFNLILACFVFLRDKSERKYYIDKFDLIFKEYSKYINIKKIGFLDNWKELLLNI